jgi:hypothetical protein
VEECHVGLSAFNLHYFTTTVCAQDTTLHLNLDYMPALAVGLPGISEPCLIFSHKYSISLRKSACEIGFANNWYWICYNTTQKICWWISGGPELPSDGRTSCGLAQNLSAGVSYSDIAIQYHHEFTYCEIWLPNLHNMIYLNTTPWHMAKIIRLARRWLNCALLSLFISKCICGHRFLVQFKITTDEWFEAPSLHQS